MKNVVNRTEISSTRAFLGCEKIPEIWFKRLNFSHPIWVAFFSFIDPRPVTSWYFSAARGYLWIFVHAGDAGNTDLFWLSDAALGGFKCTYWERTCAPQKINVLQAKAVKIKHAQLNIYNTTKLSDTHRQNVVDKSEILTLQFQLTSATFWVFVEECGRSVGGGYPHTSQHLGMQALHKKNSPTCIPTWTCAACVSKLFTADCFTLVICNISWGVRCRTFQRMACLNSES